MTPNGITFPVLAYVVYDSIVARAVTVMVVWSWPKIRAKKLAVSRVAVTVTESPAARFWVTALLRLSPALAFLSNWVLAELRAADCDAGRLAAPASAPASAAARSDCRW